METKIALYLGSNYEANELNTAMINCLSLEYLFDLIKTTVRKYNKECDMVNFMVEYSELVDSAYDVAFVSMSAFIDYKAKIYNRALAFVKKIDDYLVEQKVIEASAVCTDLQIKLNDFIISLLPINVDNKFADFGSVKIDEKFVNSAVDQIRLVDEGIVLSQVNSMELEFTPLDTESNRNSVIEKKLNRINSIAASCETAFENKFEKLLDQVSVMYGKFYDIAFAALTDGEKAEKARKLTKLINPHKQLLDKLEDKLTEANELKRQLTIHDKRLQENFEEKKNTIEEKIEANPKQWEMYTNELDSVEFMAHKYSNEIVTAVDRINAVEEDIAKHYKTLEQLDIALKAAIPTEEEMKRYSSIGFKLQDLCVRLELAKSQIQKGDKDMKDAVNTAITGLSTIIAFGTDIKDLYLRNSLVTATFRAVNAIYNFEGDTNEAVAMSQIKFITDNLTKYNNLFSAFGADLLTYRKVGNNTIRDVSIIMGKPIDLKGVLDIINVVDLSIKQISALYESMDKNNLGQIDILKAILDR